MQNKASEETRKLQFTGGSTYTISLPKKWIKQNQLNRGSILRLREEENGLLCILPKEITENQQRNEIAIIKVTPKETANTIIRKTVSAYLIGYNMLHIKSMEKNELFSKQRTALKNFARQMLVGTEIVTDTNKELKLQVLLSYPELSVQSALRRMSIITASMQRDVMKALKKLDNQQAQEVLITDNEVDRFNLYIIRELKTAIQNQRIIREIGLKTARECLGYRLVTKSVERTADHASSIAKNVMLLKRMLDNQLMNTIEQMSEIAIKMFEDALESLFRYDYELAESIVEKIREVTIIEKKAVISLQSMNIKETPQIRLIIESIRRIAEYASDIAEVVLNLSIESILSK